MNHRHLQSSIKAADTADRSIFSTILKFSYNLPMENVPPESCETCLRTIAAPGSPPQTQWKSVCRCDRPYAPSAQFSIDVCATCNKRVPPGATGRVECQGLCSCSPPTARKVPAYLKQSENDAITLDLAKVGMSADNFPSHRYSPIAILGDGARATVILCRDRQRGTKVAVKCFKRIAPTLQPTFDSETKKNKQLTHTSIAKVVDSGFHNNKTLYLVSEYKEGLNLEQCLAVHGVPTYDVAVKILIQTCEALMYAQKQGVQHKDIKPGNIIFLDDMNSETSVLITDFAMPKIRATEQLTESRDALYMNADEARGLEFTEKSEVYSIGCVGFALLTGRPPFQGDTALDIKNMHSLKLPPKISDLNFDAKRPNDLVEVVERCLEKDPGYRFESVPKLLERLEVFPRRVQTQIAALAAAKRRKKITTIAVAGLVVIALCAAGYFVLAPH